MGHHLCMRDVTAERVLTVTMNALRQAGSTRP
jgi:hypothetical protein